MVYPWDVALWGVALFKSRHEALEKYLRDFFVNSEISAILYAVHGVKEVFGWAQEGGGVEEEGGGAAGVEGRKLGEILRKGVGVDGVEKALRGARDVIGVLLAKSTGERWKEIESEEETKKREAAEADGGGEESGGRGGMPDRVFRRRRRECVRLWVVGCAVVSGETALGELNPSMLGNGVYGAGAALGVVGRGWGKEVGTWAMHWLRDHAFSNILFWPEIAEQCGIKQEQLIAKAISNTAASMWGLSEESEEERDHGSSSEELLTLCVDMLPRVVMGVRLLESLRGNFLDALEAEEEAIVVCGEMALLQVMRKGHVEVGGVYGSVRVVEEVGKGESGEESGVEEVRVEEFRICEVLLRRAAHHAIVKERRRCIEAFERYIASLKPQFRSQLLRALWRRIPTAPASAAVLDCARGWVGRGQGVGMVRGVMEDVTNGDVPGLVQKGAPDSVSNLIATAPAHIALSSFLRLSLTIPHPSPPFTPKTLNAIQDSYLAPIKTMLVDALEKKSVPPPRPAPPQSTPSSSIVLATDAHIPEEQTRAPREREDQSNLSILDFSLAQLQQAIDDSKAPRVKEGGGGGEGME